MGRESVASVVCYGYGRSGLGQILTRLRVHGSTSEGFMHCQILLFHFHAYHYLSKEYRVSSNHWSHKQLGDNHIAKLGMNWKWMTGLCHYHAENWYNSYRALHAEQVLVPHVNVGWQVTTPPHFRWYISWYSYHVEWTLHISIWSLLTTFQFVWTWSPALCTQRWAGSRCSPMGAGQQCAGLASLKHMHKLSAKNSATSECFSITARAVQLPCIFPGAPLKVNGAPRNI